MANLVIKDKALVRLQEPDMRMSRYYLDNDALMQFFQSLKLCVEAGELLSSCTRAEP